MKLTILGSGTLIPAPERGNSGYFLRTDERTILIDGGSGTLRKIADCGLDYREIDTICYTHLHPDHCFDLIPLFFALKHDPEAEMPKALRIMAPRGFQAYFGRLMDIYGESAMPEELDIEIREVLRDAVGLGNLKVICNHTEHLSHSVTYRFVDGEGKDLFYSGDTDYCKELVDSARDVDVLLLECSFPDDLKREGHLTPSECGKIASETACGRLILTHFYPQIAQTDIVSAVSRYYQGRVDLAYDGMKVVI